MCKTENIKTKNIRVPLGGEGKRRPRGVDEP